MPIVLPSELPKKTIMDGSEVMPVQDSVSLVTAKLPYIDCDTGLDSERRLMQLFIGQVTDVSAPAGLPTASEYPGGIVALSDSVVNYLGPVDLIYSDGSKWIDAHTSLPATWEP